jgi:hypothetical protein
LKDDLMRKERSHEPNEEPEPRSIALDSNPKGELKLIGGSLADDWNMRLLNLVCGSLPIDHSDRETSNEAIKAVCQATMDIAPADPIEGILIAQLMAANEAALAMYQKGWSQPPEFFAARTKYLQLADKATRTVMMLTERLDHHRGRGQQQITVKHVTTNNVTADQAIIAESVTTGGGHAVSPALLAASSVTPMPILDETRLPDPVGVGGGQKKK